MSLYSQLLLAGFFFIMGAAVIGVVWYLQSVASGNFRKGKKTEQTDPNLGEVARLMRDKTTQDLVVTMNGHTLHHASELNPGQARRLHFASKVLVKWLAEAPPPPPLEEGVDAALEPQTSGESAGSTKLDEEWIPAESASLEPQPDTVPPFSIDSAPEVKPVSTQITELVGGFLKPATTPSTTTEFKSIALQIDDILQTMIANTPFEQRGITLNDGPDGGVVVTLDGNKYLGVMDVPDEEVRSLIRSAVVEWEKTGKFSSR